jgi:hypothetical protein
MPKQSPASRLAHVEPGTLLTAAFYNDLIDAIRDLDDRLAALETYCDKSAGKKAIKR